jgi:hypothetical protein
MLRLCQYASSALLVLLVADVGISHGQVKGCGQSFEACYKACPNTLSNACLMECVKKSDAYMRQADEERRAERVIQQCKLLPASPAQFASSSNSAWSRKKLTLQDGVKHLRGLRRELESEFKWQIGDPGSFRELTTYLAEVTKLSTDVIEDLVPLSGKKIRDAKGIYENIQLGRSAYDVMTDGANGIVNAVLDFAAELNPVIRGAKTLKDFVENVSKIVETPENLMAVREEIKAQLDRIDRQISSLQQKIDQLRKEHESDEIGALLATYNEVRGLCVPPSISRP